MSRATSEAGKEAMYERVWFGTGDSLRAGKYKFEAFCRCTCTCPVPGNFFPAPHRLDPHCINCGAEKCALRPGTTHLVSEH